MSSLVTFLIPRTIGSTFIQIIFLAMMVVFRIIGWHSSIPVLVGGMRLYGVCGIMVDKSLNNWLSNWLTTSVMT